MFALQNAPARRFAVSTVPAFSRAGRRVRQPCFSRHQAARDFGIPFWL